MGRITPSFRNVLAMEKKEWKPFRDALDKSERKCFDEIWYIARLYISTCSNSIQLVPLHPIIVSILFHHCKELNECRKEVEDMLLDAKVNIIMTEREESLETSYRDMEIQEIPTTLDGLFLMISNKMKLEILCQLKYAPSIRDI